MSLEYSPYADLLPAIEDIPLKYVYGFVLNSYRPGLSFDLHWIELYP
jgi:hypothetical protein